MKQIPQGKNKHIFNAALKKWSGIILQPLLLSILFSVPSISVAAGGEGVTLLNNLLGAFGEATDVVKSEVTRQLDESGLTDAALEAKIALDQLAEGKVPVIGDLDQPFHDNVDEAIALALTKAQMATRIISKVSGPAAQKVLRFIAESPLFAEADFGMTLPSGRLRVYRKDLNVSICLTTVGPGGSMVITGISNSEHLCQNNEPRMLNPSKALLLFVDMAAGYSHLRLNQFLAPSLTGDLTAIPPALEAETYVKINGQWIQLRLAGADPSTIEVEGRLAVGVKVGFNVELKAEISGEATIKVLLKPLYAAEVIRQTSAAMLFKAESIGITDMSIESTPHEVADILQAGLDYLDSVKDVYDIGETSINLEVAGGLGVGIWDTGIDFASAGNELSLKLPLASIIAVRNETLLEDYLDIGLGMVESSMKLTTAILVGEDDEVAMQAHIDVAKSASARLWNDVLYYLTLQTTEIELSSEFKIVALGTADTDAIPIYQLGLSIPVGELIAELLENPNAIGDAGTAAAQLLLSAANGDILTDEAVWNQLSLNVLPGITFDLLSMPITLPPLPVPIGSLVGLKDASLLNVILMMAQSAQSTADVLLSITESATQNSLTPVRLSLENALTVHGQLALDVIKNSTLAHSFGLGANADLGAEVVLKLGAGFNLESELKTSVLLLLLNSPEYNEPDLTTLSKTSLPISLTLGGGASIGEGVELSVEGAGTGSINLFDFTSTHWDGYLPTPASMHVAGFPVLEFLGTINADESFSGTGFLMLPIGGIVEAWFSVDSNGEVTGTWSGGMNLGPLGDFSFISGTLENDGIHGLLDIVLLGSPLKADYILTPSGLLLGSYEGSLVIADQTLAEVSVYLGADGEFSGQYLGNIDVGGLSANTDLAINNDGFTGTGTLNILGSELVASDIVISSSGYLSATFSGEIQAGSHTLSAVTLRVVNGGLIGTAMMDLPGAGNVEVDLTIIDGKIRATYDGSFLGGLSSQASMEITDTGIMLSAALGDSLLTETSSGVIELLVDAANIAQPLIGPAQTVVDAADDVVQIAFAALSPANIASAKQVLIDSYNLLKAPFIVTFDLYHAAVTKLKSDISYYNTKLNENQTAYDKGDINWLTYNADKLFYEGLRATAQTSLNLIEPAYNFAVSSLAVLESELTEKLNDLEGLLILAYNDAVNIWNQAVEDLNELLTIASVLDVDAASLLSINSISFSADLSTLDSGGNITVSTRMMFMEYSGQVSLSLNLNDPVDSFHQLVTDLLFANIRLNTDTVAPTIVSVSPESWQSGSTLIQLVANDNSAVASITYTATGAQSIPTKTVPGNTATVLIDIEGMTTLSFYATDTSGNVSGTTTMSTSIDNSGPQINLQIPSDTTIKPYEVEVSAIDLEGSGISYLLVSAFGAETINEYIVSADSTVVSLTVSGITMLTVTAVDVAGNSTTITQEVNVPAAFVSASSGGGGSLGLLWLLLATVALYLRRLYPQQS